MNKHTIKPMMLAKMDSEKGPMTYLTYHGQPIVRPYVFWFIRSDEKNILIDTAIEAEDYKHYKPGFKDFPFQPQQSFETALESVGLAPEDIDIIIHTHLHYDHIYNTPKCKNAMIYVQQKELEFALNPHPTLEFAYPKEMIRRISFEVLNGDQTIVPGISVMLTPGHSPGGQSILIDTPKGKAVIPGFCCIMENFTPPEDIAVSVSPFATYPVISPGIHSDLFQAYDSTLKVKEIADIIIPMHDPELAVREQIP
ncbi:N-acyl homoserine lactonase family protein [Thermodesulfobacteriota bacterium]